MKFSQDKLIIKQKVEMLEVFTGFETKNRYKIIDEKGVEQYYAFEKSSWVARHFLGSHRSLLLELIDKDQKPLLVIERPFFFLSAQHTIKSIEGKVYGYINQKFKFFKRVLKILDENNSELFQIESKLFSPWTYNVFKDGIRVALISKKWSGFGKEFFTDADSFLIDFEKINTEKNKTLLLAAGFAIDLRYFERKK